LSLDSKLKEQVNQKAFSALEKTTAAKQNSQSSQKIASDATVKDTGLILQQNSLIN